MRLHIYDGMDAQITYSALEDYLAKLIHNQCTKYDGDPGYCEEDETFLRTNIDRVHLLLCDLKAVHRGIVMKG